MRSTRLYYGSGHLHQINYSQRSLAADLADMPEAPEALAMHQLICDIERDDLHQEILRSQGTVHTRYAHDALGRLTGAWSQSNSLNTQPFDPRSPGAAAWADALTNLQVAAGFTASGLLKAWQYDKVGELQASRHSLRGDTGHRYDATSRVLQTSHLSLGGIQDPLAQAANESFGYDPAGNIQDSATQLQVQKATALSQRGYVRDNLVRVYEDKRYFYDGHGRLIRKLAGKHTAQTFGWDEENHLIEVATTRRPGTEHESTQTTRFDYDAIGRRIAKHDSFGTTTFIWEGMRGCCKSGEAPAPSPMCTSQAVMCHWRGWMPMASIRIKEGWAPRKMRCCSRARTQHQRPERRARMRKEQLQTPAPPTTAWKRSTGQR